MQSVGSVGHDALYAHLGSRTQQGPRLALDSPAISTTTPIYRSHCAIRRRQQKKKTIPSKLET